MGLSGVSGPFRGAYNTFTFATANIGADYGGANGATKTKHLIWSYTIPAGMDIVIVDAQLYAGTAGAARINIEADGTSIIADTANSARGVALSSAVSVVATPSNSVFGTTTNLTPPAIGSNLAGGRRGHRHDTLVSHHASESGALGLRVSHGPRLGKSAEFGGIGDHRRRRVCVLECHHRVRGRGRGDDLRADTHAGA